MDFGYSNPNCLWVKPLNRKNTYETFYPLPLRANNLK